jgi:hypothetical protein
MEVVAVCEWNTSIGPVIDVPWSGRIGPPAPVRHLAGDYTMLGSTKQGVLYDMAALSLRYRRGGR